MGFWTLLEVALMPNLQVLIISCLGAFMATDYLNLLPANTRKTLNKIVFVVFTPCLMFVNLAETVTFRDIISWWFMPVNIGLTFLIGGIVGWIVVKILRPKPHLEGIIIATCSAGNLGNLMLIIIPAICEDGSPFGDHNTCSSKGISYSSFSMALGGFYIWTYTYHLVRSSSIRYKASITCDQEAQHVHYPNSDLQRQEDQNSYYYVIQGQTQSNVSQGSSLPSSTNQEHKPIWSKSLGLVYHILEELMAPPTLGAIFGFFVGATPWLKKLVIGEDAPLRVIQDTTKLLGEGTIPCLTLILGGNLVLGLRNARMRPPIIVTILCVRYVILPICGIGVVKAATAFGLLPDDPLFHFVLMVQFTLPPAMSIGTMVELFDVGQAECSIIFLWTYVAAAIALTVWSTIYMWILS